MNQVYGAGYNLEELVQTHLFVISANNSGSTFLKNALATSGKTWNLAKEGQHMHGFVGPSSRATCTRLIWAARQEWIDLFSDSSQYDWSRSCKAWYFQASSLSAHASIFVTKSPPFLLNVSQLKAHFKNAKFLFLVRNPYAVVEGIARRGRRQLLIGEAELFESVATHVITCMAFQRSNIETFRQEGAFFTYETMCAEPETVEQQISNLVPSLDDLILRQKLSVKGIYDEMLRDMNEQQIVRLTENDLERINRIFEKNQDLMDYFQYPLLDRPMDDSARQQPLGSKLRSIGKALKIVS